MFTEEQKAELNAIVANAIAASKAPQPAAQPAPQSANDSKWGFGKVLATVASVAAVGGAGYVAYQKFGNQA